MNTLEKSDEWIIRAAMGWLDLQMPKEALAELDQLTPAVLDHPEALQARWIILADLKDWDRGVAVTAKLVEAIPAEASSWLHHAYATRRATTGGLQAAFDILAPVAAKFASEPTIPYNLACYVCQLGHPESETMAWFERACKAGDPKELLKMALADPDLFPVRHLLEARAQKKR